MGTVFYWMKKIYLVIFTIVFNLPLVFCKTIKGDTALCLYYGSGDVPLPGGGSTCYYWQENRRKIKHDELNSHVHKIVVANPESAWKIANITMEEFPRLDTIELLSNYFAPAFDSSLAKLRIKLPESFFHLKKGIVIIVVEPLLICEQQLKKLKSEQLIIKFEDHP